MYSFPDLEPIFVPCPVLTVAFWPAYRFLMSQVRRSGSPISKNFPQFVVIHTVKGFGIVNKAEVDVFLELSCFFDDPADAGNLISGSSAFSKASLNIWKITVHILLKPGLDLWVCSNVCMLCLVDQSCLTVCDPMDCSSRAPLSMGLLRTRIPEWVAMPSSRGSSQLRGFELSSPALQMDSVLSESQGKPGMYV